MYISSKETDLKPNEGQSIKILKKLAAKYTSFFDAEEQMYLQDFVADLKPTAFDLEETVKIIGQILKPAIQIQIQAEQEESQVIQRILNETISILDEWDKNALQTGDMSIPLSAAVEEMYEYDQEQRFAQTISLHTAKTDLRSLDRALNTFLDRYAQDTSIEWVREKIMLCSIN